jgi:alginate O-acetyltransferase complex protein AlgI
VVFSSPVFLFLFLPVVLALYYFARREVSNLILLVASLFFYSWGEPRQFYIMLISIAFNYVMGLRVQHARSQAMKHLTLVIAVALNLSVLVYFKYASFLGHQLAELLPAYNLPAWLLRSQSLPIGISFFTFHALSYVVDVYRGDAEAQRNPIDMALYIALFPQLIAGPILRYHHVAPQLHGRTCTSDRFVSGMSRFVFGLGKKMLIANAVGPVADLAFNLPASHLSTPMAWIAAICYSLQLYYDFSAYSDMAIGLGRMFGFEFPENFNYPYIATSITDFWRRWHISLSTWFRDYLYIPLGGNRKGSGRTYLNLLIVFFLCGMWHGASWTFAVWGLFHGAFLVAERLGLSKQLDRVPRPVRHAYTLFVVMIGWVMFRAETLSGALVIIRAMFGFGATHGAVPIMAFVDSGAMLVLVLAAIGSMPVIPWISGQLSETATVWSERRPWAYTGLALCHAVFMLTLLTLTVVEMSAGTYNPFIYFQF